MAKNNSKPASKKTQAETICDSVSPDIREQAVTLANAVLTMQKKILSVDPY